MNFDSHAKSIQILLVDNNETTSQQLIKCGKNRDCDITSTNNVKNAINIISLEKTFDLILLNVIASELNAFQTIEFFEKSEQIPRQNIIQFMPNSFNEQELEGIQNTTDMVN